MLQQLYAAGVSTTVSDPMPSINSLKDVFGWVYNLLMGVGISLVVIMLALGFIQYIMSQGDKAGVEKAQKWVTYAVIGGLGLFLTYAIKRILISTTGATNLNAGTGDQVII